MSDSLPPSASVSRTQADAPFPLPSDPAGQQLALRGGAGGGVAYYEVTIEKAGASPLGVGVGLAPLGYPLEAKMVGWVQGSVGYHGDDGKLYHNTGQGSDFHNRFGEGDTVGCGIVVRTRDVFYTLNGTLVGVAVPGPALLVVCRSGRRGTACGRPSAHTTQRTPAS